MRLAPPLVWERRIVEKLLQKHHLMPQEIEEVLFDDRPHFKKYQTIYHAYGQTLSGRYVFIVFRYLDQSRAKLITAYDMTHKQRRYYQRIIKGN